MRQAPPIVHVGFHKTATSWFQSEFYPNVANACYVPRDIVQRSLIRPRPFEFDPLDARRHLGCDDGRRLILCDEELSGNIHLAGLHGCATAEFGRRLKAALPGARIVLFFRDPLSHVSSAYRQYVKEGGTRSPDRYVFQNSHQHRRPTFSIEHLRPGKLAEYYEELFGADRVHVFRFEEFAADPEEFVGRFSDILNLCYDQEVIEWHRQVNPGFGNRTITLGRFLNVFTARKVANKYYILDVPGFYRILRMLFERLNRIPWIRGSTSPRTILGRKVVERIECEVGGHTWANVDRASSPR